MKKRTPHWVSVRDSENAEWKRRIFVKQLNVGSYICVAAQDSTNYIVGDTYDTCTWLFMKEKDAVVKLFHQQIILEDL